ncbi:spore gernimation protein [Sporosarcina sp. P12(2017)]|nr:spore gernimation protein [Sporosarcina sp. P10]PIC61781.1 spore gernimation protein [Sporosarcina sp. P12(2017)]
MKKMMTDAIQTEDGKKALRKLMTDPEFRELLVLEQPEVKQSIENVLLSKEGELFWKTTFEDPKFTESIAKSMKKQQADIMKDLMGDASFQKELEKFFGQPDMMKQMENIVNSATLKKEMEKAIEDTINSPLMQAKWQELIMKAGKGAGEESAKGDAKEEKTDEEGK